MPSRKQASTADSGRRPAARYGTARTPSADATLAAVHPSLRARAQVYLEEMADFATEHPPGTLAWARHFRTSRPKVWLDRCVLSVEVDVRGRTICLTDVRSSNPGETLDAVQMPFWRSAKGTP